MKTYFIGSLFVLVAFSCTSCKQANVTITKDYVINPSWDKVDNSFDVIKMIVKDSSDTINLKNVSSLKLLQNLKEDTSFIYRASVLYNGTKYSERKVYFNRDNGFLWWGNLHKSTSTKKILGELQRETWYFLGGLGEEKTLFYVYLDSLDSLHKFRVSASDWTNY
jgi:hypothetical protein